VVLVEEVHTGVEVLLEPLDKVLVEEVLMLQVDI
jgi:hypothetical protein